MLSLLDLAIVIYLFVEYRLQKTENDNREEGCRSFSPIYIGSQGTMLIICIVFVALQCTCNCFFVLVSRIKVTPTTECALCRKQIIGDSEFAELNCPEEDVFHVECVKEWFEEVEMKKEEMTCPKCGKAVQVEEISNV